MLMRVVRVSYDGYGDDSDINDVVCANDKSSSDGR